MICITIGRGRHRMMMAEHKHLAEEGAKLVELRLDYIRRSVDLRRLLLERHCPVIATCRRPHERGKWMRSESDRLVLLRTAIANGADYVDLESDIAGKIPRYGETKRIISYHNFHETPQDLNAIHEMMCRLDPDIIKIATMANNPLDNIRALKLCKSKKFPTVAFCMGEMGLPSRVLCGKFGAPFTYATFNTERIMAPGQLTRDQLLGDYRYESLNEDTRLLGVIADPVAHSLSPQLHNAMIRAENLNMIYLPFRVPAEYLDDFMEHCGDLDIAGLSVTIPHKQAVLKHINALDDLAAGIKAANTIVMKGQGTLGYNTDCDAALESLKEALPTKHEERPFAGLRVLILGAGGVARTIGFGLHRLGAKVIVCTRDYRKGDALATELQCKSADWSARPTIECDVLINATPVGMHPNLDETPFEAKWFDRTVVVFDTVYNPEQTLFIKHARAAACETVTGVDMFARQAAKQFKLFTGKDPDLNMVRDVIKKSISAARYQLKTYKPVKRAKILFLIGYRATGKTTVGKLVAEALGVKWVDSDQKIEQVEGRTIAKILEEGDENDLRKIEGKVIRALAKRFDTIANTNEDDDDNDNDDDDDEIELPPVTAVISLGGGAVTHAKTRQLIDSHHCIWLHAPAEVLAERIEAMQDETPRPALTDESDMLQEVRKLLDKRQPIYSGCADYDIDTTRTSVEEAVDQIVKWLSRADNSE